MKKLFFFLMVIVLLSLSACKAVPTEEALGKSLDVPEQKWEYQTVTVHCSLDNATDYVICVNPKTGDNTIIDDLINGMGEQGYELDEVLHTNSPNGLNQTFIFRKPYVAPVLVE